MEQQVQNVSKTYADLRDVVLQLAAELKSRTSEAAAKAYNTDLARQALDEMIELIVDAAKEIHDRYAHSKSGELLPLRS